MPLSNPIAESQIPPPIARDVEFQAADVAHVNALDPHVQYLLESEALLKFLIKSPTHDHYNSITIDDLPTGFASKDANISGNMQGWHIITLLRSNNQDFGVQLAFSDTQHGAFYRRKSWGSWNSWLNLL
jgi:hypothetical protein